MSHNIQAEFLCVLMNKDGINEESFFQRFLLNDKWKQNFSFNSIAV